MIEEDVAAVVHAGWLAAEDVPRGPDRGDEEAGRHEPAGCPDGPVANDAGSDAGAEPIDGPVEGRGRCRGPGDGTDAIAAGIGARMERARTARGISQQRLARLVGVERPTVCRWERGVRIPSIPALLRTAAALAVPPSALLPDAPGEDDAAGGGAGA